MKLKKTFYFLLCSIHLCLFGETVLDIQPTPLSDHSERIGINLGTWTTWGAEQFSKNVVMNPGFEGSIDRIVVVVTDANNVSFSDEQEWGYDDDYWKNALFHVRTGNAKGTFGKITHSQRKGTNSLPTYFTEKPLPSLSPKDIIVLTKLENTDPVPNWWIADAVKERVRIDTSDKRPLSSGTQSLVLEPRTDSPAEINHYLDTLSDRAGKLLPVNGKWRLSFWMKSDTPENTLRIFFRRINGSPPFFEQIIPTTTEWKEYTFDFDAHDTGTPQTLQLSLSASGDKGKVWIDDLFLGSLQSTNTTNFRQEIVDTLLKLQPSFIRDTQGQLGDSLENRLADVYGRRSMTTRAFAGARSLSTGYSIPDLLKLCEAVKANPWIVVPTTFSENEALELGQYLAAHATTQQFSAVAVEFGNENWNWVFRSVSLPYPPQHGIIAEQIFDKIQEGAGKHVHLIKIVNGQYASPAVSKEFAESTPSADVLAIAPYFFYTLNAGKTEEQNLTELFSTETAPIQQLKELLKTAPKKLAAYEINLHTTKGNATSAERDRYVVSQAAGSALAKRLIEGLLLNVQPEIIFSLAQFDADTDNRQAKVKLWGITRDLGGSNRLRPQGLAMEMLNRIISGSLYAIDTKAHPTLTGIAFKDKDQWKAAFVNGSPHQEEISLKFSEGIAPNHLWKLHAASPMDTNEETEKVTIGKGDIQVENKTVKFAVPAWGFVILSNE